MKIYFHIKESVKYNVSHSLCTEDRGDMRRGNNKIGEERMGHSIIIPQLAYIKDLLSCSADVLHINRC